MEIRVKYSGFIKRQEVQVERESSKFGKTIPDDIDHASITTLREEARGNSLVCVPPPSVRPPAWAASHLPTSVHSSSTSRFASARKRSRPHELRRWPTDQISRIDRLHALFHAALVHAYIAHGNNITDKMNILRCN